MGQKKSKVKLYDDKREKDDKNDNISKSDNDKSNKSITKKKEKISKSVIIDRSKEPIKEIIDNLSKSEIYISKEPAKDKKENLSESEIDNLKENNENEISSKSANSDPKETIKEKKDNDNNSKSKINESISAKNLNTYFNLYDTFKNAIFYYDKLNIFAKLQNKEENKDNSTTIKTITIDIYKDVILGRIKKIDNEEEITKIVKL